MDTSGYQWHVAIQAAGEGWKEGTTLLAGSAGGLGHLQAAAPKPEIMWEAVRAVRFPEPGCPWDPMGSKPGVWNAKTCQS